MKRKKVTVIVGPTASGKSRFALDLAEKTHGEIVNADSLQVYADVPLLTARPLVWEMRDVPHHLYGFLDAFQTSSAAAWLAKAVPVLHQIDHPIVVGGTGLYVKALMEGLSDIPEIPEEIRTSVRGMRLEELRSALPDYPFQDKQRLMRALEVQKATGKSMTYWHAQPKKKAIEADFHVIFIHPPREQLYIQCNYRFLKMLDQGAMKQVIELYQKNPSASGGVFQAIGVQELHACSQGETSLFQAIDLAQIATRHYAKRQQTWFMYQLSPDVVLEKGTLVAYEAACGA